MENYILALSLPQEGYAVADSVGIKYVKRQEVVLPSYCETTDEAADTVKAQVKLMIEAEEKKNTIVAAAVTVCVLDDDIIRHTDSREQRKEILKKLAGKTHNFVTLMSVGGAGQPIESLAEETKVTLKNFDEREIDGYLEFDDPVENGVYAPFGKGALLVRKIQGDFNNIKGMPLIKFCEILENKYKITIDDGKNVWEKGSN